MGIRGKGYAFLVCDGLNRQAVEGGWAGWLADAGLRLLMLLFVVVLLTILYKR